MSTSDVLGFLPSFFYRQLFVTPPKPTTDCTGKTVIVTGSNVGLGKEAARHFVRLNAGKVIIACRTVEKGEAAKREIEESTKRTGAIEVWQLDLSSYESVKEFAKRAQGLKRLDVLLENAGINTTGVCIRLICAYTAGADCSKFKEVAGNESTVTVNVVSTFLLGLLLLPKLRESGRKFNMTPTLTIVSSEVHFFTLVSNLLHASTRRQLTGFKFPEHKAPSIFDTLNNEQEARMGDRYNVSKLLEVFACRQIAKEHPVDQLKVTLNFVNPGWCHSELVREMKSNPIVPIVMALFCRSTEVGSRPLVHAGLSGPETHGQFLSDCKVERCAPLVVQEGGAEMQQKVWTELAAKLNEIEPGVTKNLDA